MFVDAPNALSFETLEVLTFSAVIFGVIHVYPVKMELVVEVLGMIEGAMENAGRERLYRQASHLQADAKRLRNILSSSTHVCKDFSCSIYQGRFLMFNVFCA